MTDSTAAQTNEAQSNVNNPTNTLCIFDSRYCFSKNEQTQAVPRLGIGASAIVLDGIDLKSGGEIAIKFVQTYKGTSPFSEVESRERFFDCEVAKTKALINQSFLLEYLDDELLRNDRVAALRSAPGLKAYSIDLVNADELGAEVATALAELNAHIDSRPNDDVHESPWRQKLYQLRTHFRKTIKHANHPKTLNAQTINGQRMLITKKYQTTLSRLLVQQPNLTINEKLELLLELVKGLKQIHMLGITHGDLCPDNIMLQLSAKRDRKLLDELHQNGISSRYLYDLKTRLIDLGRVVKSDADVEAHTVGLPVREMNNRMAYAAIEMVATSERLPFERYRITYQNGDLVLEPLWEFDDRSDTDELLGELSVAEGTQAGSGSMAENRRLGQIFTVGDILYNATWGFMVKEKLDEKVILSADIIYCPDYENNTLAKIDPAIFMAAKTDGEQWEFDDILYVKYQQGIPVDIFAVGIVIVETLVGKMLEAGELRTFSDHCKRLNVGKNTPADVADTKEVRTVADAFKKLGLDTVFEIALRCLIRSDPALGYYCRNHAVNSAIATMHLLQDFAQITQKVIAYHEESNIEEEFRQLNDQLERYKEVLGSNTDRTAIFRDVATTKTKLDDLRINLAEKTSEISGLKALVADKGNQNTKKDQNIELLTKSSKALLEEKTGLQESLAEIENKYAGLQTEFADKTQNLDDANRKIDLMNTQLKHVSDARENLETRFTALESQLSQTQERENSLSNRLGEMKKLLTEFTEQFGHEFDRTVKAWRSRKQAAIMLKEFELTLCQDQTADKGKN